MDDMEILDAMI